MYTEVDPIAFYRKSVQEYFKRLTRRDLTDQQVDNILKEADILTTLPSIEEAVSTGYEHSPVTDAHTHMLKRYFQHQGVELSDERINEILDVSHAAADKHPMNFAAASQVLIDAYERFTEAVIHMLIDQQGG